MVCALTGLHGRAHADKNDFTLDRLIGRPSMMGATNDPNGNIPLQTQYRSLMSEMGVVMAPRLLSPADSLGLSGFSMTFDTSFTSINDKADYWQKGVQQVSGSFLPTVSVTARKGLWAFFPGFEFGAGLTYLVDSSIYGLNAYVKFAIQEGFHGWILPSIAVRAAVTRLVGTQQVGMTIVSTDATISKSFGLAGTVKLDPYLGANLLVNIIRGEVIDTTPDIDAYRQGPGSTDLNSNTVFPTQDNILRWRLFAGFRLVYAFAVFGAEFSWAFCNDTAMSCGQTSATRITDRSDGQAQISLTAGFTF